MVIGAIRWDSAPSKVGKAEPLPSPLNSFFTRFRLSPMAEMGKLLVFFGLVLIVLGVLFLLLGRTHLPIGRLPGDIIYHGKNTTFYFPLATSILVSVVLSIVLYVIGRLRR